MQKAAIKAIVKNLNKEELRDLISVAQGVLSALFSCDEIINQILSERQEAVTIAQAYKEELDKVVISDEDIKHLHNTVSKILEILKIVTPDNRNLDSIEQLKELISIDTLKTMQLLGFNYKRAIGEPLTSLCSDAILNLGLKGKPIKKK